MMFGWARRCGGPIEGAPRARVGGFVGAYVRPPLKSARAAVAAGAVRFDG